MRPRLGLAAKRYDPDREQSLRETTHYATTPNDTERKALSHSAKRLSSTPRITGTEE